MSTRIERMNDKPLNDKHSKILKTLLQLPDNKVCAECRRKDPRWASHSLGVFVCLRCSGVHRAMGTHISKMKSIDLDTWTPDQVLSMERWGNAKANWYWEAKSNALPNDTNIDSFIRAKYERKQFVRSSTLPDPATIPAGNQQPSSDTSQKQQQQQPKQTDFFANPIQSAPYTTNTSNIIATAKTTSPIQTSINSDIMNLFNAPATTQSSNNSNFASFGNMQQQPQQSTQNNSIFGAFASFQQPHPPTTVNPPNNSFANFGAFQSPPTSNTTTQPSSSNFDAFASFNTSPQQQQQQQKQNNTFSAFQSAAIPPTQPNNSNFTVTPSFANFGMSQPSTIPSPTKTMPPIYSGTILPTTMSTGIIGQLSPSPPPQLTASNNMSSPKISTQSNNDAFAELSNWGAFK